MKRYKWYSSLLLALVLLFVTSVVTCAPAEEATPPAEEESPLSDTTAPIIANISASSVTESTATITWTTDEPATSQVEYGMTTTYGSTTSLDEGLVTSHSISLSDLEPNTTYHFRVKSNDEAGNEAVSEASTFTVAARVVNDSYTQEEVNYLLEIALGVEFGDSGSVIRKWSGEVRISVFGSPMEEDLTTLDNVINDINELTREQVTLQVANESPDITIWFVPLSEMHQYEKNYVLGNWGFFWTWWTSSNEIYRANVLISSDKPSQKERNHLIREELTQSLGLMNDSWTYRDSIFYQGWTTVQEYSDIDRKIVEMLYLKKIQSGSNREQIKSIFSN